MKEFFLRANFPQLQEAKQLVRDAIAAGIFSDLGSGSNVDLCVINQAQVDHLRGYDKPATKGQRSIIIFISLRPIHQKSSSVLFIFSYSATV